MAEAFGITRAEQDAYAYQSQMRAAAVLTLTELAADPQPDPVTVLVQRPRFQRGRYGRQRGG